MKNLATKNTNDFTVTESGEAFISQRKAAELLGVDEKSIRNFLKSAHNHDVNQGVSAENLQKSATHYALFSKAANDTARNFAAKLMEAGAKAYIYHQAGYVVNAIMPAAVPILTKTELAQMVIDWFSAPTLKLLNQH